MEEAEIVLKPYTRRINYYETDQMGIVHHSNYIRFMEEARVELLSEIGLPYESMEEHRIIIPVLSVSCDYKKPARFGDVIDVFLKLTHFNGIRMSLTYEIKNHKTGELLVTATSSHCFVDENFRPIALSKTHKKEYEVLLSYLSKES